jgi:outer membrane protein assembly factor BamB
MKKFNLLLTLIILVGWFQNPSFSELVELNHIFAQDLFKGPEVPALDWKINIGENNSNIWNQNSPIIGKNGEIYISSTKSEDSGIFYAFNPDGSQNWHFKTNFRMDNITPVQSGDGTIYIYSNNSKGLYAINSIGFLKWSLDIFVDSQIMISPDGVLLFATNVDHEYYLVAINPDKTLEWYYPLMSNLYGSPVIGKDGTIYLSTIKGELSALNGDGKLKWLFESDNNNYCSSSPSIGNNGTIYCRFSSINSTDPAKSYLYAINNDGSLKWRIYTNDDLVHTSPAIGKDGTIFTYSISIVPYENYLMAIHPAGYVLWEFKLDNIPLPPPAIDSNGVIYVHTLYDHELYAINTDGSQNWRTDLLSGTISNQSSLVIGRNGIIYACTLDNVLYAIEDGSLIINPSVKKNYLFNPSSGKNLTHLQLLHWESIYNKNDDYENTDDQQITYDSHISFFPFLEWGPIYKYQVNPVNDQIFINPDYFITLKPIGNVDIISDIAKSNGYSDIFTLSSVSY